MQVSEAAGKLSRIAASAIVSLWIVACEGREASEVSKFVARSGQLKVGSVLSLDSVTGVDWKRVYIFGPYTTAEYMERCIGKSSAGGLNNGLKYQDGVDLLVVETSGGKLRGSFVRYEDAVFETTAVGKGFARGAASFEVTKPKTLKALSHPIVDCGTR